MNYNVFTKSELIEAITKDETNSWNIDIELLKILDRKVRAAHEQMNEINNNMIIALKEKDISKFCKLGKAYNIIKNAAVKAGVTSAVGCHTLRKTFGYWHYKQFNDVAMLQKIFNHTTPEETLIYIGITDEQISSTLNNFAI